MTPHVWTTTSPSSTTPDSTNGTTDHHPCGLKYAATEDTSTSPTASPAPYHATDRPSPCTPAPSHTTPTSTRKLTAAATAAVWLTGSPIRSKRFIADSVAGSGIRPDFFPRGRAGERL